MTDMKAVLRARRTELLTRGNVLAIGIGWKTVGGKRTKARSIVCSVAQKLPKSMLGVAELVPESIDGIATDVIEVGHIRALGLKPLAGPTERQRPAPGGVSIGHRDITAGTLGCLVKANGNTYILSNAHVLANTNAGIPGDPILQPGPYDGGVLATDTIAELEESVPITFLGDEPPSDCKFATAVLAALNAGCALIGSRTRYRAVRPAGIRALENLVDAAIARPLNNSLVTDTILELGPITGVANTDLGTAVRKSGRTTGVTMGEIIQIDVTTQVQYGPGQIALFTDQLMAGPISAGGDSGSAVLDEGNNFIGLLFAGSDQVTIINRAANVLLALGVTR